MQLTSRGAERFLSKEESREWSQPEVKKTLEGKSFHTYEASTPSPQACLMRRT